MGFLVASSCYNVSACSVASLGFAYVQLVHTLCNLVDITGCDWNNHIHLALPLTTLLLTPPITTCYVSSCEIFCL